MPIGCKYCKISCKLLGLLGCIASTVAAGGASWNMHVDLQWSPERSGLWHQAHFVYNFF